MSMYGPQDPYNQQPGDPYNQQPGSNPYSQPGSPPPQGGEYGQPDPYGQPPASAPPGYSQPTSGAGQVGGQAPGFHYDLGSSGMPPPVDPTIPAGQPGYGPPNPYGPPGPPAPYGPPVPPPNNNASMMWIWGGVAGLVLLIVIVVGAILIIKPGSGNGTTADPGSSPTTDEVSDTPEVSDEPSTYTETTEDDLYAGFADDDPRRGDIGDCVYAWPVNEDETRFDAALVDCDDSQANVYFYDITWATLDETTCPDSDYGPVQFWYWVDLRDDTQDHVLCGYWIA